MKVWIKKKKSKLEVAIVTNFNETLYMDMPTNILLFYLSIPYYIIKLMTFTWKSFTVWNDGFTHVNFNGVEYTYDEFKLLMTNRKNRRINNENR